MKNLVKENKKVLLGIVVFILAVITTTMFKVKINQTGGLSAEARRTQDYEQLTDDQTYYVDDEGTITDEACEYVKFEAYYTADLNGDGVAEKMLGSCKNINATDTMYFYVSINQEGSLKDGKLTLNGTNTAYTMGIVKDSLIKNNYVFSKVTNKTIEFNTIPAGMNKLITASTSASISSVSSYTGTNKIVFTGTYVDADNNEHPIRKEIDFINDWYGSARAELSELSNTVYYEAYVKKEDKSIPFSFRLSEISRELVPKSVHIEVDMAELEGEYPTNVICPNGTYDPETHILTIDRDTNSATYTCNAKIEYSDTVYDKVTNDVKYSAYTMSMPVRAYYECYNNPSEEFQNPYRTDVVTSTVYVNFTVTNANTAHYVFSLAFISGESVKKPHSDAVENSMSKKPLIDAYNSEDGEYNNFKYITAWQVRKKIYCPTNSVIGMSDSKYASSQKYGDQIAGNWLEDYTSIKYIYFRNTSFITNGDYVDIYNADTNELIKRFSYSEIEQYNLTGNKYELEGNVKHIKATTSSINPVVGSMFNIYMEKEIDVSLFKEAFSRYQVEGMGEIKTTIAGYVDGRLDVQGSEQCALDVAKNYAEVTLSQTEASTLNKLNEKIYITIPTTNPIYSEWKDGTFVVEVPSEIMYMKINSITSNNGVNVAGYDLYKENGHYLIKIITTNTHPTSGFSINIDSDMTVDPRTSSRTVRMKLYAYNDNCLRNYYDARDIYDVNGNGNRSEYVFTEYADLYLYSEAAFVSLETLTNYDDEHSINIAPNIADIKTDVRSATVNVDIINNFTSRTDNISVLGKIPFEGNTFFEGNNLGSEYTATMKDTGIRVPDELKSYAKVYYTTVENPTKDLNNAANGWTLAENVASFDAVRCYLIVLENYKMYPSYGYEFSYDINIPADVEINDTTYSCHIVYYDLMTDGGRVSYSVQPSKLGVRVVDYYNLNLTKVKENTDLAIPGATYLVTEVMPEDADPELAPETRMAVSASDGSLVFENLRINQEYTIKEIKASGNYELSDVVRTFKLVEGNNGSLELVSDVEFDGEVTIGRDSEGKVVVESIVEDVPKIELTLNKYDKNSNEPIKGAVFIINGTRYVTNSQGKISVSGLSFNTVNTLKETSAKGYYLDDTEYEFTINKDDNNNITITTTNEYIANAEIVNSDDADLVSVSIGIPNEKIPTYDLKIVKVNERNEEETLEGARFILSRIDDGNRDVLTTDADGEAKARNLYQVVDGKYISGRYILQESESPSGYSNNQEEIEFTVRENDEGTLDVAFANDNYVTVSKAEFEGGTLVLTIKDKPLFIVNKVDKDTGDPLANAEFVIYKVDANGNTIGFATDANGEFIGTENENGYYVVRTNENGQLTAPLPDGTYKIIEVKAPEGYRLYTGAEIFTITEGNKWVINKVETEVITEIYTVEDLVKFSNSVNHGDNYTELTVKLMNDLDIASDDSYENPESDLGDINRDGVNEGIKTELTKESGRGFIPIGYRTAAFSGVFDGQGHSISNLYIKEDGIAGERRIGFFGEINNATVKNFGIESGTIKVDKNDYNYDTYIGGLVGYTANNSNIKNCYNKANISFNLTSSYYASVYAGGITADSDSNCMLENCYNRGNINISGRSNVYAAGIKGRGSGIVKNSYNTGNIVIGSGNNRAYTYPIGSNSNYSDYVQNSYYLDGITITNVSSDRSVAKTSEEMKTAEFVELLGTANWKMDENSSNDGYPVLNIAGDDIQVERITEINYIEDLVDFEKQVNSGISYRGYTVKLNNNLDFQDVNSYRNADDTTYGDLNGNGNIETIKDELTSGFTPIGNYDNHFNGVFDGQGYEIKNLYISTGNEYAGFFGYCKNSNIQNFRVSGEMHVNANVDSILIDGGIVGYADSSAIVNCGSNVNIDITGNALGVRAGGIVGCRYSTPINNCYNDGNITTNCSYYSTTNNNYGEIICGIACGNDLGECYNCYNRGNLESKSKSSDLSNVYSISISGIASRGASNSYNTGNIKCDESTLGSAKIGAIGYVDTTENSYYLSSADINKNYDDGSEAKDEASMKTEAFVNTLGNKNWSLDSENINNGYPILKNLNVECISEINYIEDLVELSKYVNAGFKCPEDSFITLKRDLDFNDNDSYLNPDDTSYGDINGDGNVTGIKEELTTGTGFTPIGSSSAPFIGKFDGQNHKIENLYINKTSGDCGVFGTSYSLEVKDLSLSGNITAPNAGSICGYVGNIVKIYNCKNYCNINSSNNAGGFIGNAIGSYGYSTTKVCIIDNCINYGDITTGSYAGGLAGYINNYSGVELYNNINNGEVTASNNLGDKGGLVGYYSYNASTSIKKCTNNGNIGGYYSAGLIGEISNSGLIIEECNNTGTISTTYYGGGLIGDVYGGKTLQISNCNNSGDVISIRDDAYAYLGGIAGYVRTNVQIEYSYNTGNVGSVDNSAYDAGGIVGYFSNSGESINNCYNLGTIYDARYCGGIAGEANSSIINSYNKGNIVNSISSEYIGGIAGQSTAPIDRCYSTGNISVIINNNITHYVGGISGAGYETSITHSFNKGNINIESNGDNRSGVYVGGVAGQINNGQAVYCYNNGDINAYSTANGGYLYVGGIIGSGSPVYSYNTGNITNRYYGTNSTNSQSVYMGGVVGVSGNNGLTYSYNTGNVKNECIDPNNYMYVYVGGAVGYNSNGSIAYVYNTGDVDNKVICGDTSGSYIYVGGVSGSCGTAVTNIYNTGNVTSDVNSNTPSYLDVYVGGISGSGTIVYTYNTGDVINIIRNGYNIAKTGPIVANGSRTANRFYLDTIQVIGPNIDDDIYTTRAVSDEELKSDEVYELLHASGQNWKKVEGAYPILEFPVYTESNESDVEITIKDAKLEYDITAEVGENTNGVRIGGSVSGTYNNKYIESMYRKYIETVSHGGNSTEAITITPDSGYEVAEITIDGERLNFLSDENGVVTIPAGYFENITKNHNVVAIFAPSNEMLVINKVDDDNNPVEGAVFDIHQVEERETPTGVVGELVQDGQQSTYVDATTTHNDILGTLTNNGTYYFTQQSDGKLKANNLAANTTADSYMKIDLTDSTKNYRIRVNYSNSMSTAGRCSGLVAVTNNTTALTTSSSTGRFVYSTSIQTNVNSSYSQVLQAGNVYYLHFAQIVNANYSLSSGQGFTINSISVQEEAIIPAYTFENVDGKYVSNNSETYPVTTTATAYIPVDLRGKTGKYNIVVNNEINGQYHYGYIVVNDSRSRVTSSYGGISKSGTAAASDYSVVVEGGKMYYVHLVHYNYSLTTSIYQDNTFTINSVNVTLNGSDLTHVLGLVTGADGKVRANLKYGKYAIVEQSAPEEYVKSEEETIHTIGEGTNNNVTIVNNKKRVVIVHYYLYGTGPEFGNEPEALLSDKYYHGIEGEEYTTSPILQIEKYHLLARNNEFIIPENASGYFAEDPINVYYYYEKEKAPYNVHYIYGEEEDLSALVTDEAEIDSQVTTYENKDKDGYVFKEVVNLPLTISENPDENNIYVLYEKDEFEYKVKYYFEDNNGEYQERQDLEETNTALFESEVSTYEDKVIDGYKLNRAVALDENGDEKDLPLVIGTDESKNVIKVYYERDNFSYTVHYFYQGVENTLMKSTKQAKFGSSITSQDIDDKNIEGYKLDRIKRLDDNGDEQDLPLVISSDADKNVINVYYVKDNFDYTIEYYYDNVKDDSKTVTGTAEFESVIESYEDKVIDGYKLDKTENKPMTITSTAANNVMKVFYVKDTFEYEVHYFYEGVEDTSKAETGLSAVFGTEISNYTDKNIPGYKLEKTRALDENGQEGPLPLVIKSDKTKNRINIYYIKDDLGYEVHYFYDGVENTTLKESGNSTIGERISSYTDKCPDGYKLEKAKALNDNGEEADLPLIIKVDESKNIINVYYIKDNFDYTIEYYYDNVKDESKTVQGRAEFGSVIDTYEDKVIDGYKFDKTENKPMTITSTAANNVMKVYYIKDSFDYTIEYYYDNVKDDSKTESDTAEFGSVINEYEDKVIDGYKFDKTENKPMTITSTAANNVMKVFYVKDNFDYTVEYYYNGVIDNTKTETFSAEFGSTINDYASKPIDGYKFSTAKALDENGVEKELPLVIKSNPNKNKIRVYYIKDNFDYTIEYYYDNVKDDSKTVPGNAEFGSVIDTYEDKVIDGYKLDRVENKPMTITSTAANNVMKVYYVKDNFDYTIEYYYDNVKDESKTVQGNAEFGSVIDTYEDKVIDGYKFDKTENKPMTITSTAANNVMKVFYVKEDFGYTVHYFYEGVEDESKKIEETAKFGTEITEVPDKNITGYKKQRIEGLPLTISSNPNENVVNVYYIRDELGYTVHYFYDNVEDENQMINENATFGTTIESVPDKNKTGYKQDRIEGLPLTISANPNENIVNVYYVKDSFGYTVHYFYDNVEDESKKIEDTKLFGEQITEVPDKNIEGYEYSRTEGLPLTISANPEENVINVFYVRKAQGTVIVEYVDNLTGETIAESTIMTGDVGSPFTVTRIDVPGHKLDIDNLPDESGTYKDTPQTVTYKYIKLRPYELLVRYTSGDNDEAKIGVRFGDTFIDEYTTNGELKIADIELTDLETEVYTVYETETPEFCKTIVSEEKPAVVELKGILNTEKNKYEFVPTYDAIEGFNVIIDEENSRVIFDITTKKEEKYDLAVKKFITNINGTEITNRAPEVTVGEDGKVTYKTNDTIEKTANKQNITYTIRMYNESEIRAKGKRVIEYIPDGLVFVPENEINTMYGWEMYRISENGNLIKTNNIEEAKVVATDYLDGKEIGAINVAEKQINSLDVKVVFVVDESKLTSEDRIIENKVKIIPNENDDNTDNDETTEKAYVQFFDLSIEKYIEKVTVNTNGNETTEEVGYDKKGELVKVDVKRSEVNSTKLTVTYGLVIKNVGEIPGYATEITDYVPENFKLVEDGNWTLNGNKAVSTTLKDIELNPGESTIVNITFEWNLAEGNIGERRNEAEITAYANEYDAEDITKDNKDGEDLLVSIKTGSEVVKVVEMIAMYTAIFALGVYFVKRKVVIRTRK